MEWDYTYTKEDMQAFAAEQYRRSRVSGVLLRVVAALSAVFAFWLAMQGVRLGRPHGFGQGGHAWHAGILLVYGVLALVMLGLAFWALWCSRPQNLARRAVKRAARLQPEVFGPWHVALREDQLLVCQGGAQMASDPSVIDDALVCGAGVLVYTHGKKRSFGLPARLFEDREAMRRAADEARRCAALARAELLRRQAELLASPAPEEPLPPQPPLPQGEQAVFAAPIRLRPQELFGAVYAANRGVVPARRAVRLTQAMTALCLALGVLSGVRGDWGYSAMMLGLGAIMGAAALSRAPFVLKNAVRRIVESEQAVRLTEPGWLVAGQNGFTHTGGARCSYVPYSQLAEAGQDGQYLFLLFQTNMILIVPKRGFESPAKAGEAFLFLRQKAARRKGK